MAGFSAWSTRQAECLEVKGGVVGGEIAPPAVDREDYGRTERAVFALG